MGQVFISYSRRNKEIVDRIVSEMDRASMDVWIDREDIKAGNSWRLQIVQAIDACDAFVLMLSAHPAPSLTPTQTDTPTMTFTPTLDRSANSIVVLLEGKTGDLQRCARIRFAANVIDPEGVKQVIVRFHVGDKEPNARNFASSGAELYLTNEKDQLWTGYFNDSISQYQRTTYWWFIVIDANGIATFYYEPGRFNYFARDFGCDVIPQ